MQSVRVQTPLRGRCAHLGRALLAGFLLVHSASSALAAGCGGMSDLALRRLGAVQEGRARGRVRVADARCRTQVSDVQRDEDPDGSRRRHGGLVECDGAEPLGHHRCAQPRSRVAGGAIDRRIGRRFTTLAPAYSTTRIQIHDAEGGKTNVTICGFDESGRTVIQKERGGRSGPEEKLELRCLQRRRQRAGREAGREVRQPLPVQYPHRHGSDRVELSGHGFRGPARAPGGGARNRRSLLLGQPHGPGEGRPAGVSQGERPRRRAARVHGQGIRRSARAAVRLPEQDPRQLPARQRSARLHLLAALHRHRPPAGACRLAQAGA